MSTNLISNSLDGFSAFRRRIEDQMIIAGFGGLFEDYDSELLEFYRSGESEAYVLASFGIYS